jgi:uncharacterized SAM-binding protein YcdF (DUF218 family)
MKKLFSVFIYSGFAITALLVAGFLLYASIILLWSKNAEDLNDADSIIVLTGSKGRIEAGFELLLMDKSPRLLISGVTNGVTFQEIVNARDMGRNDKQKIRNHCCIELDYIADTTETNAIESASWIQKKNIKSIILVTSYLHMPRAALQFNRALPNTVTVQSYPVRSERRLSLFTSTDFWLYSAHEYIKYLGSWVRLENQK